MFLLGMDLLLTILSMSESYLLYLGMPKWPRTSHLKSNKLFVRLNAERMFASFYSVADIRNVFI